MDNLLKMFQTARKTTGELSGTAPSATYVEALLIHFTMLTTEDDDSHYVGWGHLKENPESILTAEEIEGWREEFDLSIGMEVRAPYLGERADNRSTKNII